MTKNQEKWVSTMLESCRDNSKSAVLSSFRFTERGIDSAAYVILYLLARSHATSFPNFLESVVPSNKKKSFNKNDDSKADSKSPMEPANPVDAEREGNKKMSTFVDIFYDLMGGRSNDTSINSHSDEGGQIPHEDSNSNESIESISPSPSQEAAVGLDLSSLSPSDRLPNGGLEESSSRLHKAATISGMPIVNRTLANRRFSTAELHHENNFRLVKRNSQSTLLHDFYETATQFDSDFFGDQLQSGLFIDNGSENTLFGESFHRARDSSLGWKPSDDGLFSVMLPNNRIDDLGIYACGKSKEETGLLEDIEMFLLDRIDYSFDSFEVILDFPTFFHNRMKSRSVMSYRSAPSNEELLLGNHTTSEPGFFALGWRAFKDACSDVFSTVKRNYPPSKVVDLDRVKFYESVEELAKKVGFIYESYDLTTEDGYILKLERIRSSQFLNTESQSTMSPVKPKPQSVSGIKTSEEEIDLEAEASKSSEFDDFVMVDRVLFLQHGVMDSSFSWCCNSVDASLAFVAANQGYDVFLGNFRGAYNRRNHLNKDITTEEFYNFSINEHGFQDVPAMVKKIVDIKDYEKSRGKCKFYTIVGCCHSLGGAASLMHIINKREKKQRHYFDGLVLVSPAGIIRDLSLQTRAGARALDLTLAKWSNCLSFTDKRIISFVTKGINELKNVMPSAELLIALILLIITGGNDKDPTRGPFSTVQQITQNFLLSGSSTKVYVHLRQQIHSGQFTAYDYSSSSYHQHFLDFDKASKQAKTTNMKVYGTEKPPSYTEMYYLIDVPVRLVAGGKDRLISAKDVFVHYEKMKAQGVRVKYEVFEHCGHIDFTSGLSLPAVNGLIRLINETTAEAIRRKTS